MDTIENIGRQLAALKTYPTLEIAHYILTSVAVRADIVKLHQREDRPFVQSHPLSSWLSVVLMCLAGAMFQAILLGKPPIAPFAASDRMILMTVIWYLVFCFPLDLFHRLVKFQPILWTLHLMAELRRTHMVYDGVVKAAEVYPAGYFPMVANACARGAAGGFMRLFERMLRGVWMPVQNEFISPSTTFKVVVLSAVTVILHREGFITSSVPLIFFAISMVFVYFRFAALLFGLTNPFLPFENLVSSVLLGGVMSAYRRVTTDGRPAEQSAADRRRSRGSESSVHNGAADKKRQ